MNQQTRELCDAAILLYHVSEMKKKGIITPEHAEKISALIRERHTKNCLSIVVDISEDSEYCIA